MSKQNRGCFITLEGTEGVGKSTNLAYIETLLQQAGTDYQLTRSRVVRHWLKSCGRCYWHPVTSRLLMMLNC